MAHPDDETLGCGMALAAAAQNIERLELILVTDGENSHPGSRKYPGSALTALRTLELKGALDELVGDLPTRITRLHMPDGASNFDMIREDKLAEICHQLKNRDVRTIWSNWAGDPHCDHEMAAAIALSVGEQLSIPVWSCPIWGRFETPSLLRTSACTFFGERENLMKRAAMGHYRSQLTALIDDAPDGFLMPSDKVDRFAAEPEIFIRER